MDSLLLTLAVLACPVGMGLMMWMMMGRGKGSAEDKNTQVTQLRAEVDQLKAERAARTEGAR
ncbi:hypothetical protein [Alloactinosynnema sp. L-07]|uniref:hypothetical protein n=1 Tax=Alloactinosynnema sp. L-07 TaxID=1653480 RepID=UPI00065EF735|nr:hypothetical protein [Alloactinosynnema sp. L-07]CRK55246.1 hypothetical protein [Alloactinosynnema sp. L-07]